MHEGRKTVSKATGWEMEIAVIGLGRMGANIARRLARGGHRVVVFNRSAAKALELAKEEPAHRGGDPLWPTGKEARPAAPPLGHGPRRRSHGRDDCGSHGNPLPGDVIIDGGQLELPRFHAAGRRDQQTRGSTSSTAGTSGGIQGLTEGYSLMVGGEKPVVEGLRPVFETLAPSPNRGWGHVGPAGSGHFVKMVHNGIEYGLMQAYAEGFEILKARKDFDLDLHQVAEIWRSGSVVRSMAPRPHRREPLGRSGAERDQGLGGRLRRGPLDGLRGHQRGCSGPRDHAGPHDALCEPPGRELRSKASGRHAQQVRGTRGKDSDR